MKTVLQAAAAIVPLLAIPADAASSMICNTRMGSKLVAVVPTSTTTVTATQRPTLTVNLQSTMTRWSPAVYTFTEFTTETSTTTDTTITDVFTTTTTEMPIFTHIDTSMITSWSTSTATVSSTSTTTIAVPSGFRNIRDTLNADSGLQRRAPAHPHAGVFPEKRASNKQGVLALQYPSRVDCTSTRPNSNTYTATNRLAATTKTIPYWAYRTTSVSTISSTLTIVPDDVTSTETDTETSTVTVSSTTFLTDFEQTSTTATALMHGPTVWNACNDQNYFGPNFNHNANGASFPYYVTNVDNNGAYVGSNYKIVANGAGSMLECCNNCMKFGTCETFMYRAHSRNCFLMYHDGETCPSQGNHPNFFLSTSGSDTGAGWQLGNGVCGYTYSGNTDSTLWRVDS